MKSDKRTEKIAGIGTAAVKDRTGKGWAEWFAILDAVDAAKMPHEEIAAYLYERLKISEWWSQMVTVGYEQARGSRKKNQTPAG